jgi:DNA-binding NarL/FixJ family response regulator
VISVLLADDHILVRSSLERLLEQTDEIKVVGVVESGEAALELDARLEPDVILMDISMPGLSGIETTRQICANRSDASVVMLTASTDRTQVLNALDAGAVGYLIKDSDPATLIEGVLEAARGNAPLDPRAARALLDSRSSSTHTMTARETEELRSIADGLAGSEIPRRQ